MPTDRPNILLITSDQQHYDTLGVTNPRIQTPALDRLAAEGTRFDRAYCPNPTCTPTRASIITGMYPSQHGAWSLGTKLFEDVPVVGDRFQAAGYATALIGKAHFQQLATQPGMESLESQPLMRDLDFWRGWHGPWYGFEHVEVARNHADETHAGQHYGVWMEDNGLKNWLDYFQPWPPTGKGRRGAQYWNREKRAWALPEEFHYSRWTADRTIAHLAKSVGEGRPFFTWASFQDPHPPYLVPEPWASMYDPAEIVCGHVHPEEHARNPRHFGMTQDREADFSYYQTEDFGAHGLHCHLTDEDELKKNIACYYGMISLMDQQIGRILDELDRLGAAENTLIVFSTDHGHFLGSHGLVAKGAFHYEDMIRVPWLLRWPGRTPAGAVSEDIQSLVDIAPSLLAATGQEIPGLMTGANQVPSWTGQGGVRDHAIVENRHTYSRVHLRTYVDRRHKITVYRTGDDGELFDLVEDPGEISNLWHDPAAADLKREMLYKFMQATLAAEPTRMPRIWGA